MRIWKYIHQLNFFFFQHFLSFFAALFPSVFKPVLLLFFFIYVQKGTSATFYISYQLPNIQSRPTVIFNSTTSWFQFPFLPHAYFCLKVFLSLVFDFYLLFFSPTACAESPHAFIFTTHNSDRTEMRPAWVGCNGLGGVKWRWISKAITSHKKTLFLADTYSRDVFKGT